MTFHYSDELKAYMKDKGKSIILIEVVSPKYAEFEVTELYVHFVDERQAKYFQEKERYRLIQTECGSVLLPHFRLNYDEDVYFSLKKFLWITSIKYSGIRL